MSEAYGTGVDGPGRPTMNDVAALAGVGTKTVSRVFNDVPSVAPDLVRRVRSAADKLGYRPNLTASSLRRRDGRTSTIGLLVEDVSNPFSSALQRAVEDVARARASLVLSASLDEDPERERNLANALIDRQIDGLIIVPAGRDHSYLAAAQRNGTKIVFLDRPPHLLRADAVLSDNHDGARRAVAHLAGFGHRRIAYLGDEPTIHTAGLRLAGYRDGLATAGAVADDALVRHGLRTSAEATDAAVELLGGPVSPGRRAADDPRPTALFCSQNLVTIGAVRALRQLGLQHTLPIVGFDDFLLADTLDPGITVVAQDIPGMGRLAGDLLFRQIEGEEPAASLHTIPSHLISRGSGELPAPAA